MGAAALSMARHATIGSPMAKKWRFYVVPTGGPARLGSPAVAAIVMAVGR
ncbi:MAG: hypothetical protein NVS1B3_16540 [Candidatus Dormibacteraceae bacterium]